MKRPAYSSPTPGNPRRFMKMPRTEKPKKARPTKADKLLERIRQTLIGHAATYINTPWGAAALDALDDVGPSLAQIQYEADYRRSFPDTPA